jgi:diadenylate cyclase
MDWLFDTFNALNLASFKFKDLVDIILVAVGIYYLLIIIQGTRAMRIALGIIFLVALSTLSETYKLVTVQWLLSNFFAYLVIAIIILFQSEIRRALAQIVKNPFKRVSYRADESMRTLEEICLAASLLATKRIGAIVVLEREQGLRNFIEAGREIDAKVNYDLLLSVFHPASPLHDGAAIIQENRIAAASCFLPLTTNPLLSTTMGTRHRAAIGVTEETDAVAVVVSEETGSMRVAQFGRISRPLDGKGLLTVLTRILVDDKRLATSEELIRAGEPVEGELLRAEEYAGNTR